MYKWDHPLDPPKVVKQDLKSLVPVDTPQPKTDISTDNGREGIKWRKWDKCYIIDTDTYGFDKDIAHRTHVLQSVLELQNTGNEILMLLGGPDLHPSLYNQSKHPWNDNKNDAPTQEERFELKILRRALELRIPVVGICRGAQLIAVNEGAQLIQHMEGHRNTNHKIKTIYPAWKAEIEINSDHHQAIYAPSLDPQDALVLCSLYWSTPRKYYMNATTVIDKAEVREIEIVFFRQSGALCFQGHPEWCDKGSDFREYAIRLINHYL